MTLADDVASLKDLRRMVRQLARLVEISLTLNSTLDLDRLLLQIIDTAADLLDCEAASILLFDEQAGQLRFAASTGSDPQKLSQIPVPLDHSIAGTIFRQNRPLVIDDVQSDPRHYAPVGKQVQFQTRSLLGVPMRIQDQVTGVLEALNKRGQPERSGQGTFSEQDIHVLSIIASQAAVAIHNARLVSALRQAYGEISRIDRIKSNLLALASHELRTPLGIILGYATFLKEDAQGELSEHASHVLASALQMRSVLETMAHMDLLQAGGIDFTPRRITLDEVLESARREMETMAYTKQQAIRLALPEAPVWIHADPTKLQLVFSNLLHNAVRFSPEGTAIVVTALEQPEGVLVAVQDHGIGIPEGELEKIFEEFYQVEHHMTRHFDGLGLGLTIARGMVNLHGGRIWAESPGPGLGACLKVQLRYSPPEMVEEKSTTEGAKRTTETSEKNL
jgi:K+-sensing histidine kinase KdpD